MPATSAKKATKPSAVSNASSSVGKSRNSNKPLALDSKFPLAQYASVLGVQLILVGFTALYLPQSTRLFTPLAVRKTTDRPQSEFMEALTVDPLSTLCWISVGLTLVEVWWAGWMRSWAFERPTKGTTDEIKLERVRFDSLRFAKLKDAAAFTICATLAMHVVIVAFGAPLTTHVLQTMFLAFVVAILTAFTPAFVLGMPSLASDTPSLITRLTWIRLFVELSPKNAIECAMVYPAVGTMVGSWLGAIPIALDWDRPWQAWPLTPLFGGIGGYLMGALLAFTLSTVRYLAAEHIRSQPSKTD